MITSLGFHSVYESFEDDAAWGSVRSSISGGQHTAPSISNQGITWTANNSISEVTTGVGAALSGEWGFYTLPHGNPPTIGDGFVGTSPTPMVGVGGWIRTNTPPAGISLWLDIGLPGEMEVDFQGNDVLGTAHRFFGVINTNGFTRFDYLETEFGIDEQKLIFADDFTVATAVPPCDFNLDLACTIDDLNALLLEGPVAPGVTVTPGMNDQFDLNGDGVIDNVDVDQWLAGAATRNGLGSPYQRGDTNLDGVVDGSDFGLWNANKFTSTLLWNDGNFDGNAVTDGSDFGLWNTHKFTSSDGAWAVPEPVTVAFLVVGVVLVGVARERASRGTG